MRGTLRWIGLPTDVKMGVAEVNNPALKVSAGRLSEWLYIRETPMTASAFASMTACKNSHCIFSAAFVYT